MKKLLLAAALGAVVAAPAVAQSDATYQPGEGRYDAPSMQVQNVTPNASPARPTVGPDATTSDISARQAYEASTSNPAHWKASNPYNYEVPGG